jgi:hypothetical protein
MNKTLKPVKDTPSPNDRPSGKSGAFFAECDEALSIIKAWLEQHGLEASGFTASESDAFVRLVELGSFEWITVASAGRAFSLPSFDRLFRAVIETDTELWTAGADTEFGLHLFCSMVANWDFLTPYLVEATEGTSLTSIRDALSRIEARVRCPIEKSSDSFVPGEGRFVRNGLVVDPEQFTASARLDAEIHELVVKRQADRLASLTPTERDLYDAADEQEALSGCELCNRTEIHDLNSRTKQCLSNLVKLGLLRKAPGRKGYLRTPTKS